MTDMLTLALAAVLTAPTGQASTDNLSASVVDRLPNTVVRQAERKAFDARRVHARRVEAHMRAAGVTCDKALVAVLANAWHESRWDPTYVHADSRRTASVGIFQVNSGGFRSGTFRIKTYQCLDKNVRRIVEDRRFKDWYVYYKKNPEASSGALSYRFAQRVLVCAKRFHGQRQVTADAWYRALRPKNT